METTPQKKKLIILPGWNGDKNSWTGFTTLAENDFEVEVIELPCFGLEPCPSSIWGVEDYAKFVSDKIKLINQSTNQPIILLGHSFGGQIATYLVAHEPHIADKLILSGAAVYRKPDNIRKKIFKFVAKSGKIIFSLPVLNKIADFMRKVLYKLAGTGDYNRAKGIRKDIFLKIIKQDVSNFLPDIKIPTLIVWGDKDTFVSVKDGENIAKNIVGARLEVIKGGTHGLHLWKKEVLLNLIKHFSN